MRESCTYGSVRGAVGNHRPYRDRLSRVDGTIEPRGGRVNAGESGGPLSGVRVLDIGTMIAGPVAATFLGDFGAEVIKLEQPKFGDPLRQIGPFVNGESLLFNVEGRNKKSVTADLHIEEGRALLRKLAEKSDVLVENFRPGTMAAWGLGYEDLKRINPSLIMLSTSGYGQTGPYATRPGYDRMALAFGGLLHITGYPDRPPVRPGTWLADYQSALYGAFAVLLAIYHRDVRGGGGQQIDLALYETVFRFTDILVAAYDKLGIRRERQGNLSFAAAPGEHFRTADGRYIVLTVSSNPMFRRLCSAMNRLDLINDERFATHDSRYANLAEINRLVADWIETNSFETLRGLLELHGVAFSLVYSVEDIVADPHYAARNNIVTVDNPRTGSIRMQSVVPRLCSTPGPPIRAAASLGANNDEIYKGVLGLSDEALQALKEVGAI